MSQDYSRHGRDQTDNLKPSLSPYYSNLSINFNGPNSQTPFESIQKVYNFVNKRKKHSPSSHKSMQFPPNTKFFSSNTPIEEKIAVIPEKKTNRSISRPKSGENMKNSKSLQQSRSSNSLATSKNFGAELQTTHLLVPNKKGLGSPLEHDASKVSKYLLPKALANNEMTSNSFDREKEETRFTKLEDSHQSNSRISKNLSLNKSSKQRQAAYIKKNIPNLPRDEAASLSFSSFRKHNFSHNNSIIHENSQFHLVGHEDPCSSEFNFESPIPTNRAAAHDEDFSDLKKRFSPQARLAGNSKERSFNKSSVAKKKAKVPKSHGSRVLDKGTEGQTPEGNTTVITKGSLEGTRSNTFEKILPPTGKSVKVGSNMQSLDLKKICNFYDEEGCQIQSHSSFSMIPEMSIRTTDPTHRGKVAQNNFIRVEDSLDHRFPSQFQNNFGLLETSHFNTNQATVATEKDKKSSRKASEQIKVREQGKPKNEYEEKAQKSSVASISNNNQPQEKKHQIKPVSRASSKPEYSIKTTLSTNPPLSGNKSPQVQTAKGIAKDSRPSTEPALEHLIQARFTEASNQMRMVSSPNLNKMEKIYELQQEIKKLQLFGVNGKKNQSLTPNPSSRNARVKTSNSRSSHSKEGKPRFLNPSKLKEPRPSQSTIVAEHSNSNSTHKLDSTSSIIERIKKQTKLNSYTSNDKFHAKSQSLGFQEPQQNKSFQSFQHAHQVVPDLSNVQLPRKSAIAQSRSQDYNVLFSSLTKAEHTHKEPAYKGSKLVQSRYQPESLSQSQSVQGPLTPNQHYQVFGGLETFNKGELKLGALQPWELTAQEEPLEPLQEIGNSDINDSDVYNKNQSRNLFEISCLHNDSLSHVLDESLRLPKSAQPQSKDNSSSGNNSRKAVGVKEQHGGFEIIRSFESSRNNLSRDNTARSNFDKQMRESALEVKIDEQEDEEESILNRDRSSFLNILDMQIPRRESEKKSLRISTREYKDRYQDRSVRSPFANKYEFKPSFMVDWEGHANTVTSIVKDTDKNVIWSASKDNSIMAWVVRDFLVGLDPRVSSLDRENSKTVVKGKKAVECLMYDEINQMLFSGGADHEIQVLDSATWEPVRKFKGHKGGVFGLAKLGHNSFLSCSGDQTIKKWDLHKGVCTETWKEHSNRVTNILYDRAKFAHSFVSCSAEGTIKIWDMRTHHSVATLSDHQLDVTSLVYINGQCNIASGSLDQTVKIWDLNMRTVVHDSFVGSPVHSLVHCSKSNKIVVGADQLKIIHSDENFDIETCEDQNGHIGSIRTMLIDNELDVLYTGGVDNMIKVWLLKRNKFL